jgi:D-lactate dehydrogenase
MGVGNQLIALAKACSQNVKVPDIACCGFAGNKGFSTPEINQNSLRNLKAEIPKGCQHGVSMSSTCQIGLSNHSGLPYGSIEGLLNECSE